MCYECIKFDLYYFSANFVDLSVLQTEKKQMSNLRNTTPTPTSYGKSEFLAAEHIFRLKSCF